MGDDTRPEPTAPPGRPQAPPGRPGDPPPDRCEDPQPGRPQAPPPDAPEFGPSGYLPERASRRARKIVLRAPLGLQWVIAALAAGVVVVVAGVLFLQRSAEPPAAPWVEAGTIASIGTARADHHLDVLLVGAGGRIRAFAGALDVAYCAESNRLEAPDGSVWNLTGRGLGGVASLDEYPTLVHDGRLYVDPTESRPGPSPSDQEAQPACS